MKKILIADDVEMNREILAAIFCEQFEIIQAEDGEQAIRIIAAEKGDLSLIFLDLMMPKKNGMEVLEFLNEANLIDKVPVIMITGEATVDSDVKAYEYGAADIIYKPFSRRVVTRRALNIIELYEQRQDIENKLDLRTAELKDAMNKLSETHAMLRTNNEFLMNALSSVVEFRSLESGVHIQRVQKLTRIMLENWRVIHTDCTFTDYDINQMVSASALHDLGKIAIPDAILCKPGKLTDEEFEIMKTHTTKGCEILEKFKQEDTDFYKYSYDICRYHHEKYDGKGYPDGLKGDEIPIWAQVVSIVDVFDSLVSPRVYKAPYEIDEAFRIIHNGECGVFNPEIMKCFDTAKFEIIGATEGVDD